jgi:hypothetical protein
VSQESASQEDRVAVLTPEDAAELARIGLALRREIEARYAKMRTLTDEDLRARVG